MGIARRKIYRIDRRVYDAIMEITGGALMIREITTGEKATNKDHERLAIKWMFNLAPRDAKELRRC